MMIEQGKRSMQSTDETEKALNCSTETEWG